MTIRLAAIGTGYFSEYHYDAWSRIPGVSLEGACTRSNEQRLREIAQRHGVRRFVLERAHLHGRIHAIADLPRPRRFNKGVAERPGRHRRGEGRVKRTLGAAEPQCAESGLTGLTFIVVTIPADDE